ncbi:MAG: hypothetical protein U5K79_25740 [Cyclobacteriaceae bacterium]|nr:hypothetical protein [Cyclobacteriaceae bacterium]
MPVAEELMAAPIETVAEDRKFMSLEAASTIKRNEDSKKPIITPKGKRSVAVNIA